MKKLLVVLLLLISIVFLVWVCSVVKCEVLTASHIDKFPLENNGVISDVTFRKIIRYSDDFSYVYCVSNNKRLGTTLKFENKKGKWSLANYESNWSKLGGSADDIVWPYFWHYYTEGK